MLLKISLGLAILVGLATLYVTNVQVGTKITDLNTQLSQTTSELNTSKENEQKLTADNRTLKGQV
jgi:cell division protein FtsL